MYVCKLRINCVHTQNIIISAQHIRTNDLTRCWIFMFTSMMMACWQIVYVTHAWHPPIRGVFKNELIQIYFYAIRMQKKNCKRQSPSKCLLAQMGLREEKWSNCGHSVWTQIKSKHIVAIVHVCHRKRNKLDASETKSSFLFNFSLHKTPVELSAQKNEQRETALTKVHLVRRCKWSSLHK